VDGRWPDRWASALVISPDGMFLYAANRRQPGDDRPGAGDDIAIFAVSEADGTLELVVSSPTDEQTSGACSTYLVPPGFPTVVLLRSEALTPEGTFAPPLTITLFRATTRMMGSCIRATCASSTTTTRVAAAAATTWVAQGRAGFWWLIRTRTASPSTR
jgi:hypothetical protein